MTTESGPLKDPSIRAALELYMSPELYQQVTQSARVPNLGGLTIEATSLSLRISNLDLAFDENPQEEMMYINALCKVTESIIHRNSGTIRSEIVSGDYTRAFFGVYPGQADHVLQAVTTALELREALVDFQEIKSQVQFGIGVNTGEVVYGNIGSPKRFDFGIFGQPVRQADFLAEAAASNTRSNLMIGEGVLKALPEDYLRAELFWLTTPRSTIRTYTVFGLQES